MNNNNEFGKRLRQIRYQKNLSQEELALQCDMQPSHIGQLERGQKMPTLYTLNKISDGLQIPLPELLDFQSEPKIQQNSPTLNRIIAYISKLSEHEQEQIFEIVKNVINFHSDTI